MVAFFYGLVFIKYFLFRLIGMTDFTTATKQNAVIYFTKAIIKID